MATEMKLAQNAKKIALMIVGTAAQKYMTELQNQQEILMNAADIIMDAYAMETAILRAQKLAAKRQCRKPNCDGAGFLQRRDSTH